LKQVGYGDEDLTDKPVIGILNTWSDLSPCHAHFRTRVEDVKRGVLQAGGFPVEIPALPVNEMYMKPSPLLYRNLLAMEVEELLRSQPVDGAVLMGGCDKTTPGLLMGAISMNLPTIFVPAGPMMPGHFRGQPIGSGTDAWKLWYERRAGTVDDRTWREVEDGIARSPGQCMTMGTASTMTAMAEILGFALPGASSVPAMDANHARLAARAGRRIVEMVWEDLKPRSFLEPRSFDNAITVDMAIGGSTNAIIHLVALAGRAGIQLPLERFDEISRQTPVIADVRPAGRFLMQQFYEAGGLLGLLTRIAERLHLDCGTITGQPLGAGLEGAAVWNDEVIRPLDRPLYPEGGTAVLRGNLAPHGAVIKQTAIDPRFLRHAGRAVVFGSYADLVARIDDEALEVDASSVLVLKNAGPLGAPGMPEWGMLPIPKKLLRQGVRDMLRVSDARMSGTSFGACVLHVSPEAHVGGPLALVENGDLIELDVPERRLHLAVPDDELARRRAAFVPPPPRYRRGYGLLFSRSVTQAHEGCDFDFLRAEGETDEPAIY
jgi:dihydroxy-acid dehydratase